MFISNYFRLQKIDTRIDQVTARLEKIKELLEDNMEIIEINNQYIEKLTEINIIDNEISIHEVSISKLTLKKQLFESNLYGGKVHNPKELQEIQEEISHLRCNIDSLETSVIDLMMIKEKKLIICKEIENKLNDVKDSQALIKVDLLKEETSLNLEVSNLFEEKKAVANGLSAQEFDLYNRLRSQKKGLAITTVSDGECDSCGNLLTPAVMQSVKSNEKINYCPSCGRILYSL